MQSPAERLASLSKPERAAFLATLTDEQAAALLQDWDGFLARPEQIEPPGDWEIWLALAGRGWGKTETGAQWIKRRVKEGARSIALVAETQKDLEEVMAPRIARLCPDASVRMRPVRITWPNGATALGYNGTEPNQLRGPEFDTAWVDELAKYRYARETWDQLAFTMRSATGLQPRTLVTTTPRPIEVIKSILSGQEGKVHVTRGSTADNRANLAEGFLAKIERRYAGTRLGRQELEAEVLGDLPGALWSMASLDAYRLRTQPAEIKRIVVAVDPAVSADESSDEHGLIVAGIDGEGRGVVLEDATLRGGPSDWARRAVSLYTSWGADAVIVERNQGGDMVAHTVRTISAAVNIREVTATRGKHVRAEPIAALYEQGKVVHVGAFPELETQMTQMTNSGYQGNGSPDRLDALVWALTDLFPDMIEPVRSIPLPVMPRTSHGWMGA